MPVEADAPMLAQHFPEARQAGEALRSAGLRLGVAESCTGGLLGAALTAVPGSSDYLLGGVIAYSNELKQALLGVPEATLQAHGAVSEEVAAAMARGARQRLGVDVAAAITGVAGPGGESVDKPAGLVWVAVSGPQPDALRTQRLDGDHGREGNRAAAVHAALRLIVDAVEPPA